jgi:hypothetical protein
MPALLLDRNFYRSSGKADWGKFLAGELGLIFVAAVGAVLAFFIYRYVFHLLVIMPLVAGGILGVVGEQNVAKSQCRNRWLAALAGLAAACVFFFGRYYVEFLWSAGWKVWDRVDVIPDLILLHIQKDVFTRHFQQARGPDPVLNGILLSVEFLCAAGLAIAIPFKRTGAVYCDACDKWAESEATTVRFDAAEWIVVAMAREQLGDLPEFTPVDADIAHKKCPPCTRVTLEHCPDAAEKGCPIYLSLRRYPKGREADQIRVKRVEIDQLETLQLMSKMPGLRGEDAESSPKTPDVLVGDDSESNSDG